MVNRCNPRPEYLSFSNIWLSGGYKLIPYNKEQCIERCRVDDLCFAINVKDKLTENCYLYRKKAGNSKNGEEHARRDSNGANLIIFTNVLKLLDFAFKTKDVRVKSEVHTRGIIRTNSEDDCMEECKEDALCTVITFELDQKDINVMNCYLYSKETLLCDTGKCLMLERKVGFMTQFG